MAETAFQQYARQTSALSRLSLLGVEAELQQMRGDFEGALGSYRKAVVQLGRAGQKEAAATFLQQFASLSVILGQTSSAFSFAQQQKLEGEELETVAFLQTMTGNTSAAEQSLQRFGSSQERDRLLLALRTDFLLDPIRSDPRFAELVRKVGLPQ
jgi:hypothetical protein